MANVTMTPAALEQLTRLPRVVRERIGTLFRRLQDWPAVSGAKPLTGNLAGSYRMRTGDYRLRFRVKGETVIVVKIGQRSDFYDE